MPPESRLLALPVKGVQHAMHHRREQDRQHHEEHETRVERIGTGEELSTGCRWRGDGAHAAEQHGCIEEGVTPREVLEMHVAGHAAAERHADKGTGRAGVTHQAPGEVPRQNWALVPGFVHSTATKMGEERHLVTLLRHDGLP